MRRSELVALDVVHLKVSDEGFVITIAKSKTDQEAQGRVPDSPYCPVQSVLDWMAMAGIEQDALFRRVTKGNKLTANRLTDQSVARIVKKLAARAGLMASQYAGHSLRSGFLTSAAEQRASIFKMQAQSRHKSLDVLSGYVRAHELFEDHARGRTSDFKEERRRFVRPPRPSTTAVTGTTHPARARRDGLQSEVSNSRTS
jgi:integrase